MTAGHLFCVAFAALFITVTGASFLIYRWPTAPKFELAVWLAMTVVWAANFGVFTVLTYAEATGWQRM